jgi:hypothetical protein
MALTALILSATFGFAQVASASDDHSHGSRQSAAPTAAAPQATPPAQSQRPDESQMQRPGRDLMKEMQSMPAHDHGADPDACCRLNKSAPVQ